MGWWTLGEVQDGLGDPREGPGRVGGPLGMSRTYWGTLEEVRDGSGNLGDVRYVSGDSQGGLGRVGGH